jgi:NitT/TauT family transport system ATP-binding protein
MEIVHDHGGRMNVFQLNELTRHDFGHTLAVVMAGEMIDFLDTPKEMVLLTDLGHRFLASDINGRKTLFQHQVVNLGVFRLLLTMLEKDERRRVERGIVEKVFVHRLEMRAEEAKRLFETVVAWGRFGELLRYNPAKGMLSLAHRRGKQKVGAP